MKKYGLIIFMMASMAFLLIEAIEYNKLVLKKDEYKEEPKVEKKAEEENLKAFKESIDGLGANIKNINKEKSEYIAIIDFEGKFIDFEEYINKIIKNKRIIKDYDIKGDKELLKVNLRIQ